MKAYRYDSVSKKYVGEVNCQIDPLETQVKGEPVYLLPANCTYELPLEYKDGFDVVWNGNAWEYKEISQPSEEDKKQARIDELKAQLDSTDYKIIKCSECSLAGVELPYNIAELHAERQALRDEINQLEGK